MKWLLLCLLLAPPALAESTPAQRLGSTQQQLTTAEAESRELRAREAAIDVEIKDLRDKLVSATAAIERSEKELTELESSLADLEGTAARRGVQLAAQRQQLSETIALLQRLALTPPAAQLFSTTPPLDRLRTDMQLKAILPEIEKRSADLAATVADLRVLQTRLEDQRKRVLAERATHTRQLASLESLMAERSRRLASTRSLYQRSQQRADRLAEQAQSLRELIDRMEAESRLMLEEDAQFTPLPALPTTLPASATRRLPVSAPALRRFGERDEFGSVSKGVTLRPRPGTVAAAVASGRVAFAGPFRGYGRVLIVEHSGGYHTVLAGLERIAVEVGQRVAAGEPLGMVSGQSDPPPELYFEVRRNGTPVDPLGRHAEQLSQSRSP